MNDDDLNKLKFLAERGDAQSQFELGNIYYFGTHGYKEDNIEAFKWFKLSAEQDHSSAQYRVGWMYYHGLCGLKKNYIETVKWFKLCNNKQEHEEFSKYFIKKMLIKIRESGDKKLLIEALKMINPDEYKLEIRSLKKQL